MQACRLPAGRNHCMHMVMERDLAETGQLGFLVVFKSLSSTPHLYLTHRAWGFFLEYLSRGDLQPRLQPAQLDSPITCPQCSGSDLQPHCTPTFGCQFPSEFCFILVWFLLQKKQCAVPYKCCQAASRMLQCRSSLLFQYLSGPYNTHSLFALLISLDHHHTLQLKYCYYWVFSTYVFQTVFTYYLFRLPGCQKRCCKKTSPYANSCKNSVANSPRQKPVVICPNFPIRNIQPFSANVTAFPSLPNGIIFQRQFCLAHDLIFS